MKRKLTEQTYNTCLETSDWRYSATIIGLIKYFEEHGIKYEAVGDCLYYNEEDITEEKYLLFVEAYYGERFHHIAVENMMKESSFSEAQIKLVNEKLKANTVIKKVMSNITFDGSNSNEIFKRIKDNRLEIIRETFRNKNDMYKNYCNANLLFTTENESSRLTGYNIDFAKKGKSASYNFDKINYTGQDILEFDFIPMAFEGGRETFFVNDNITIENLRRTDKAYQNLITLDSKIDQKLDARKILFKAIIESENFIDFDIEIITKNQDKDYFETMYIRKQNLKVLRKIKDFYQTFCISIKITDQYWINLQEYVINCILNNLRTDEMIELFLKNQEREYVVSKLIALNILIQEGGVEMEKKTKVAYACAKEVNKRLPSNKLSSYRQKLTSAIVFHDYDRVCEILLQLSNYAEVSFDFAYDLFEDFEANKDIAYSFINALSSKPTDKEKEDLKNE